MNTPDEYAHVTISTYADAQKILITGSIIMDTQTHTPYLVEIVKHANGCDYYGYIEDGAGYPLMLEGVPYKLPRGDTQRYTTLYTPPVTG